MKCPICKNPMEYKGNEIWICRECGYIYDKKEEYKDNSYIDEDPDMFFCPVCCCLMTPVTNESGDLVLICHCGYQEDF